MEPQQLSHLEDNFFRLIRNTDITFRFLQIFENYSLLDESACTKILTTEGKMDRAYNFYKTLIDRDEHVSSYSSLSCRPRVPRNLYEVLLQALKVTKQAKALEIAEMNDPSKEHEDKRMKKTARVFEVLKSVGILLPSCSSGASWIPGDAIFKVAENSVGDTLEVVRSKIGAIRWLLCLDKSFLNRQENSNCNRVHLDILKFLMTQGQDLGRSLFQTVNYLSPSEFHELILYMKEHGLTKYLQKLPEKDENGATILHRAIKIADLKSETIQLILELGGFTINEPDRYGNTVLHYAALGGRDRPQIAMLAELGADWKVKNVNDETPVHTAVRSANFDCLEYLLVDLAADVNAQNKSGFTPLHLALTNSAALGPKIHKMVETLINLKADLSAPDKEGNTVKAVADSCFKQGLIDKRTVELFVEPKKTFIGCWNRYEPFL